MVGNSPSSSQIYFQCRGIQFISRLASVAHCSPFCSAHPAKALSFALFIRQISSFCLILKTQTAPSWRRALAANVRKGLCRIYAKLLSLFEYFNTLVKRTELLLAGRSNRLAERHLGKQLPAGWNIPFRFHRFVN